MKKCPKCNTSKDESLFGLNSTAYDGLQAWCKECAKIIRAEKTRLIREADKECGICHTIKSFDQFQKIRANKDDIWKCQECRLRIREEYSIEYREKTREDRIAYLREYRKTHKTVHSEESKEKSKARMRDQYKNDPEYRQRILESRKQYIEANPDGAKEWYAANREYCLAQSKEWRKDHPKESRDISKRARRKRRAQIRNGVARCTDTIMHAKYERQDGRCFYCNSEVPFPAVKEHIYSICRGGDDRPSNVVISCKSCNDLKWEYILHEEWSPVPIKTVPSYLYIQRLLIGLMNDLHDIGIECRVINRNRLVFDGSDFVIEGVSLFWDTDRYKMKQLILMENVQYIYEDELKNNRGAIINSIKHEFGKSDTTFARKCTVIHEYDYAKSRDFCEQYHLHGFSATNSYRVGLEDVNGELVALLMAGKNGMNKNLKESEYELSRICIKGNIPGGVSKLFSAFIAKYSPSKIITYSDPIKRAGSIYTSLGFRVSSTPVPLIVYAVDGERVGERTIWNRIDNKTLPYCAPEIGEYRNARANGIYRVFYPGLVKYVWDNK